MPGGRVVHEAVSLRDIPATVVDLIGGKDESPFPGRSLTRTWNGSPAEEPQAVNAPLSELDAPDREAARVRPGTAPPPGPSQAILAGSTVYIRHETAPEELYDLDLDPTESRNLSGSKSAAPVRPKPPDPQPARRWNQTPGRAPPWRESPHRPPVQKDH